jgi:hypothetical protein
MKVNTIMHYSDEGEQKLEELVRLCFTRKYTSHSYLSKLGHIR